VGLKIVSEQRQMRQPAWVSGGLLLLRSSLPIDVQQPLCSVQILHFRRWDALAARQQGCSQH